MALSLRQIEDVCMHGKGSSQCRFLAEDDSGTFLCLKKWSEKRNRIDREVNLWKKSVKAKNLDPASMDKPIGDHCQGYVFLLNKKQGYDVP